MLTILIFETLLNGSPVQGVDADQSEPECSLYLAPSSTTGSCLGTFSGRDIAESGTIGHPELVYNIFDLGLHAGFEAEQASAIVDLDWAGSDMLAQLESKYVKSLAPGLGSTVNGHPGLNNIMLGKPQQVSSPPRVSDKNEEIHPLDKSSPAAGAITYFGKLKTYATSPIKAGSELFAKFSDDYFSSRQEVYGPAPLSKHFNIADSIVERFVNFRKENEDEPEESKFSDELLADLWDAVLSAYSGVAPLRAALPNDVAGVLRARETGSAFESVPSFIRSPEWLEENGKCIDKVRPGLSPIENAGRGAFAARSLQKGEVILPMPVVPIKRGLLDMHNFTNDLEFPGRLIRSKAITTKQLLLNYCFGHPRSSLLLYPYGTMSGLVNHASSGMSPNAELAWATEPANEFECFHQSSWLGMTPEEVFTKRNETTNMMLEIRAIREIEDGEEILLDYGKDWESAYEKHVMEWQENEPSAKEESCDVSDEPAAWRTGLEQQNEPYPQNTVTACFYLPMTIHQPEQRKVRGGDSVGVVWKRSLPYGELSRRVQTCEILERFPETDYNEVEEDVEYKYTVWVHPNKEIPANFLMFDVPAEEIMLMKVPYTSDQHWTGAFRHEIGIPENVFPPAWISP